MKSKFLRIWWKLYAFLFVPPAWMGGVRVAFLGGLISSVLPMIGIGGAPKPAPPAPPPVYQPSGGSVPKAEETSGNKVLVYVLGGLGVLGLIFGVMFMGGGRRR